MTQENNLVVDKLTPVGFRVLIKTWEKPTMTKEGLLLAESENKGMPVLGQIILEGKKTWVQKLQVLLGLKPKYKVGTWVYFRKYSIDEFKLNTPEGELELYVLEEAEICGLVSTQ
jgi:co-chaperonin GroES (HSP10)